MINGAIHHKSVLSLITPPEWTVFLSEISFRVEKLKNYPYLPQDVSTCEPTEAETMTSSLYSRRDKSINSEILASS